MSIMTVNECSLLDKVEKIVAACRELNVESHDANCCCFACKVTKIIKE